MTPAFIMVDDFVANPHELRRRALGLGYDNSQASGNYPGVTSARALPIKGIDDYVSRLTGLDRAPTTADGIHAAGYPDINRLVEDVVNRDTLKPAARGKSFTAPMRFNRLILFSPWMFDNSAPGFGTGPDDGRLAYLMFFAAAS